MSVRHNAEGGPRPADRRTHTNTEELTVGFVRLVENILLKVLLVLHGGVQLTVIVLKQTHTGRETVDELGH